MRKDVGAPVIEHDDIVYERYKIDNVCSCASCAAYNNSKLCIVLRQQCDVDTVYVATALQE